MIRRLLAAIAAGAAALALAGCVGDTEPVDQATVTATGATLKAKGSCFAGEEGEWWFQYRKVGTTAWTPTARTNFGPCPQDVQDVALTKPVSGLKPNTSYEYILAGREKDGAGNWSTPWYCGKTDDTCREGADPVGPYHNFTTLDGYPSLTQIDRDGDFDCTPPSLGCGGQLTGTAEGAFPNTVDGGQWPGHASIVTSPVGEGKYAGKFLADCTAGEQCRAEISWPEGSPGAEYTWEFLLRVPSSVTFIDHIAIGQTKQGGAGSSCYSGGVEIIHDGTFGSSGTLNLATVGECDGSGHESEEFDHSLGSFARGQWVAIKVHEKFAEAGFVEAWVDPDGTGPQPYANQVPLTARDTVADTTIGVKNRAGWYQRANSTSDYILIDGWHMDCITAC